jgi:sarcosine oxidase delta subunit
VNTTKLNFTEKKKGKRKKWVQVLYDDDEVRGRNRMKWVQARGCNRYTDKISRFLASLTTKKNHPAIEYTDISVRGKD